MGGSRVWKKLMIKQIHVYELNVPPRPKKISKTLNVEKERKKKKRMKIGGGNTRIIQDPPFGPMFDHHGQRPHTFIDLDIGPNHAGVFQSQSVVDVHVTSQPEFWIPDRHDGHVGVRYTDDPFHTVCFEESQSKTGDEEASGGERDVRRARTSANRHTCSSSLYVVVIHISTRRGEKKNQ